MATLLIIAIVLDVLTTDKLLASFNKLTKLRRCVRSVCNSQNDDNADDTDDSDDSGADAGDADNNCICTAGLLPMVKLPSVAAT